MSRPARPLAIGAWTLRAALVLVSATALPARAQDGARDPMRPPAAALAADPAAAGGAAPAATPLPRQIMVVDGRRYVVVGTRRLGVGDLLGTARIERIEDAAIVVREGGVQQRLALHGGIRTTPAVESRPKTEVTKVTKATVATDAPVPRRAQGGPAAPRPARPDRQPRRGAP